MKRVKISMGILVVIVISLFCLIGYIQSTCYDVIESAYNIQQLILKDDIENATLQLNELVQKWQKYRPIAVALSGRQYADEITHPIERASLFLINNDAHDLYKNLNDIIVATRLMLEAESLTIRNLF